MEFRINFETDVTETTAMNCMEGLGLQQCRTATINGQVSGWGFCDAGDVDRIADMLESDDRVVSYVD